MGWDGWVGDLLKEKWGRRAVTIALLLSVEEEEEKKPTNRLGGVCVCGTVLPLL